MRKQRTNNMNKFSKELIVGFTAIITILLFVWLFSFLKGNNLFVSSDRYYAVFDDIGGLEESAPVEINGYKAGIVRDIRFINDGSGKLLVSFGISRGYNIPVGSVAEITPETILAGMKVQIIMANTSVYLNNGDTLESRLDKGFMGSMDAELTPLIEKADEIITSIDTLLNGMKLILNDELRENIGRSTRNISEASYKLDTLIGKSGDNISSLIYNLDNFSAMLAKNTSAVDSSLKNISAITGELSESDLKASVDNFNIAVKETTSLLEKLNRGEGSAGLIMNDDSLYINLTNSLGQLNLLMEDIKSNPGRYVNFSIFGRKNE